MQYASLDASDTVGLPYLLNRGVKDKKRMSLKLYQFLS